MANAITYLTITHDSRRSVVSKQTDLFGNADVADKYRDFVNNLMNDLASALGGSEAASIIARMENGTNTTKASGTVTLTAVATANEIIIVGGTTFTWVAATANENEVTIGANVTASAANLATMINAHSALKGIVSATSSAGVCTITAVVPGREGNAIRLAKEGLAATGTITFTGLPVADETITVNGTVFTFKASAAAEDQITIGADATATAVNTVAKIDAHSVTKWQVDASNAAGVVTVTALQRGTSGNQKTLAESATNTAVSGATLTGGTDQTVTTVSGAALSGATATQQVAPITFVLGGV